VKKPELKAKKYVSSVKNQPTKGVGEMKSEKNSGKKLRP
jgi:hypothetical protein